MKKLVSLVLALMMVFGMTAAVAEEPIKITWAMGTGSTAPIDNAMVLEELNKISREAIGVECDIQYFTNDQLQNSINTGEVFDIYFTCGWYNNVIDCLSLGLFADVSGKIQEFAPDMYAAFPQNIWDLVTDKSGAIRVLPNKKDYAAMNFVSYPKDVAKELGFEIPAKLETWGELTPFLEAWKATMPEGQYPVMIGGSARGLESSFDFISRDAMIGCIYGTTKVVTQFDDPALMERWHTLADWYAKGLINPDAPLITEDAIDTKAMRVDFVQAWPDHDYSPQNGYPTGLALYAGPNTNLVDGAYGSANALSVTLEDDPARMEAALKYLNLIFSNQLFADTMRYGVKGYHWDYVTEEQNAHCAGGVLRTEVGKTNYGPWAFSQPNYFGTTTNVSQEQVDGTAAQPVMDPYTSYFEAVANDGVVSAMGGFQWDNSAWTSQLAEIRAIRSEYYSNFGTGAVNIDDVYEEMMAKLNAAGLQDMIADAQAQLDAYLAK